MTSEGQDAPAPAPLPQQLPSRPASPPKERSLTPKLLTPVLTTSDINIMNTAENPPSKRRSLSPMPPSAHSDSFPNPFNAPFHSHSLPASSLNSRSAPPEGLPSPIVEANKPQMQQTPRSYNYKPGFKLQSPAIAKLGPDNRKPSPDDGAFPEPFFPKEDDKRRTPSIPKPRKGSRAGDSHRRTSSGGLTTIPYIPKGFRNIISNEPAQTPLMQAIHNPISLDTGGPPTTFGSSLQRLNSPHHVGPPKLGLNTQFGSRTGSPEPGSSATPTTAASPGSPMGRRRSRADGEKPPGSAKGRARQRSLLPKSASIQFESVPYPFANSESSVFVQVSPRASATALQFQPPMMPYQPHPPSQHHQHQLPPPHNHGSPPLGPAGPPPHGHFMSPIGPPPGHYGPPPPSGYPHFGPHLSQSMPPRSPSSQHQTLPPPPHRPPPPGGSGNPFSSNGVHPPPEFRPIDYGYPRGGPLPPRHEFSPVMSNMGSNLGSNLGPNLGPNLGQNMAPNIGPAAGEGLRKALFPQHDRPMDRKTSMSRSTPFSGAPSTYMDDVASPTSSHFHPPPHPPHLERRDQPIVAPKSPSPGLGHQIGSGYPLGSLYFVHDNKRPGFDILQPASPTSFYQPHNPSLTTLPPPLPLSTSVTSPTEEQSNFITQPTTPTMPRRKGSGKSGQTSKAGSAASTGQRVSVSTKPPQQPPQSPQQSKVEANGSIKDVPPSPATPMIKRRSAYVAGGGIKTTDLALPKPDVVELTAPPPDSASTGAVDADMLILNKPRKRNKANPSVLRTREKEVDDAMTGILDDAEEQLAREMNESEIISEEPEERKKEMSKEAEQPVKVGRRKGRRSKFESPDDEDEEMEDAPPATQTTPPKKGRRSRYSKSAPSVVSEETATEAEQYEPAVLGKRPRRATLKAKNADEGKRRRTRRMGAEDAGVHTDDVSNTSATESVVAPEPPVVVKKPGRRGRKPAIKDEKKAALADETASDVDSVSEAPKQLMVNGKPIKLPTPPPGFKKPGLVSWYRGRERPKFTEGDEYLDTEHTIRRLKDRGRLHHLKTSVTFFEMPTLIDEDGWTDTEQELEKMGRSRPVDNNKSQKTALWDSKISDAAFEKGFQQLEKEGSVEPLSAADTPGNHGPELAPSRQPTTLSHMELVKDDTEVAGTLMEEVALSTAVATPMAELDTEVFQTKEPSPEPAFVLPTHTIGFGAMHGRAAPQLKKYKHTERKKKTKHLTAEEARNLKGVKWTVPHLEGRPAEILKQTWDMQAQKRKAKEALEEAQALAEEANGDKPKKRGGRRGKKKTKGDLKNLAYAREVRRAKLEGAKIHTPDEDNLSVVSDYPGGAYGGESDVTMADDLTENSDHDSDWSAEEEEPETPEWMEMEGKYQEAMENPEVKAFLEDWVPKLFPTLYEVPEDKTRNRGAVYTDAEEFGKAIDTALEIDDQELLQAVTSHTLTEYALVTDEKTRLDAYQVKRGFLKPETVLRRASKRKVEEAGLDEGEDGPGPRYSTRRRTVKNPDADDQIGMTGYSTPRIDGLAQTPEREVRPYRGRGRGGRGGRGRGGAAANVMKSEGAVGVNPATGLPASGPGSRGGRGGRGSGRGRGRGRGRGQAAAAAAAAAAASASASAV